MTKTLADDVNDAATRAITELYHAYFTGLLLTVNSRRSAADAGRFSFQVFRRQHHDKFLSSLDKLGLSALPHAVLAAQYHYLANAVGGVETQYMYESDRKAWVRFVHPRWMYEGTALCAIPVEVSHGFLNAWYGQNGVSLGNPRLGFVCTSQDMTGQYGLAGYFQEFDDDLQPDQRVQFSPGEDAPPFDPEAAPVLDQSTWPAERLLRTRRNYAMDFVGVAIPELIGLFGPAEGGWLGNITGQLIARQYYRQLADAVGISGDGPADFAAFMSAMATAQDDAHEWDQVGDTVFFRQQGWRMMRGRKNLASAAFDAWNGLWEGALSAHNRFLCLEVLQRLDYGDDCFEWRIRPRRPSKVG